jgi:hypothetical protein
MVAAVPLLEHSDNDHLDLRYSLRGLEMHVNPDKVYIIGYKPAWLNNVIHIPFVDIMENKMRERNIFEKLLQVPEDEFLYFSDDNFLLGPLESPYYFDMPLYNKMAGLQRGSSYRHTISNTIRLAGNMGNYDNHAPFYIYKDQLNKLKKYDWTLPYGYCMKTLYAAVAGIQGFQYPDLKIRMHESVPSLEGRTWFSTADGIVERMKDQMDIFYPTPSRYEQMAPAAPKLTAKERKALDKQFKTNVS